MPAKSALLIPRRHGEWRSGHVGEVDTFTRSACRLGSGARLLECADVHGPGDISAGDDTDHVAMGHHDGEGTTTHDGRTL